MNDPDASLTVRTSPDGPATEISRSAWRFTDDTHVALEGGFEPFHWYRLVYRTARAPVAGCGLLAVRDIVSHLRATPGALGSSGSSHGILHAFGYGVSQSGRLLRQLLWDGLNVDEAGSTVFDGVFSHIASGARGEFNHRYAQPSVTQVNGFGNLPPWIEPAGGRRRRQRGRRHPAACRHRARRGIYRLEPAASRRRPARRALRAARQQAGIPAEQLVAGRLHLPADVPAVVDAAVAGYRPGETPSSALVSNDPARIAGFLTDDWVIVSESGISSREEFLRVVASGDLTHAAMQLISDARSASMGTRRFSPDG